MRYTPTMKTTILSAIGLILILSPSCAANTDKGAENYCKDPASWQQWHELLDKYPQDDTLFALYATRRGLCSMVESKQINQDRATRIFNRMHESLIARKREEFEREQGEEKQGM